jgi:hypothetical protein
MDWTKMETGSDVMNSHPSSNIAVMVVMGIHRHSTTTSGAAKTSLITFWA